MWGAGALCCEGAYRMGAGYVTLALTEAEISKGPSFKDWGAETLTASLDDPNIFALDTGCIWGNCLTAMRLEDQQHFSVSCADVNIVE